MSESTSSIICANGSTIEENSKLNVSHEVPLIVEHTRNTDQNMEISDDESTITIGEISCDEYYDEIIYGKQAVHEELYCTNQNEQSGSSNNVSVINNEDNDNEENLVREDLIINDIFLALPTIVQIHRPNRAQIREHTHRQSRVQRTHRQNNEHTLSSRVCHRQACNNVVMSVEPRNKPRAAAVKAAAKIAKSCMKRKYTHSKKKSIKIYFSCGHREKIGGTSLKRIGINVPRIMKESRLLDERLMMTTYFLLKLPAALTVEQILNDFQRKANLCSEVMDLIFTAFNHAIPTWCLYYIERLQYNELVVRFPNHQMSELYGLAHLLRFIACLPRLYHKMKPHRTEFHMYCTSFMNKFMDYLVEENLCVDIENDYEKVIPEYHQFTYQSIRV